MRWRGSAVEKGQLTCPILPTPIVDSQATDLLNRLRYFVAFAQIFAVFKGVGHKCLL